ncbi:hypothetical protein PV05_05214 [Exophiala xenobiotica]|uniref:Uncharacterized protein n=1 Tax=Exophiala xenobiotica TaxID=348802 RepID=A0A0D2BVS2_9EURO|nr:uncharacterized protein PV05_05214 [Exophiala xenobiotica]KIW56561.1 hypothetical protein PV05_05214 [Exophiala xenobiotica]
MPNRLPREDVRRRGQLHQQHNLISVTPEAEIPWPAYANAVIDKATNWLWVFSYVDSSFGGSYLGRTLRLNVNQLQNSTGDFSDAMTLRGVSDYLISCVDNVLVALSSARLVASNATSPVQARVAVAAVTLGETKYICGILALNMVVCLVYVAEALRTRFWRDMPRLELMDLTSVVIAAWKGGIVYAGGTAKDDAFGAETISKRLPITLSERTASIPSIIPAAASEMVSSSTESLLAKNRSR